MENKKTTISTKEAFAKIERQIEEARSSRIAAEDLRTQSQQEFQNQLDRQFLEDNFSYQSYQGPPEEYQGSEQQSLTYRNLLLKKSKLKDIEYRDYILSKYGTLQKYFREEKITLKSSVYNPETDYILDVTVITKDAQYKSDHISADEVIMESLSGICTFEYIKVDNSVGKTTGTLDADYIPSDHQKWRSYFFSTLANDRVVVWDILKQRWNSFYMSRLLKFVRDDSTDLE